MSGRLEGKRALVTGAGQGMGRAIALAFAAEGAAVVATSRTLSKLQDLPAAAAGITVAELDVTDKARVHEVVAQSGDLDILVNCAAWVHNGTILDCNEADWERSWSQNVTSIYHTVHAALPGMLERGHGNIINVASVASSITGVASRAAYGATKAAVIGLSKAIARDFVGKGIRCNALCPGTTDSPSLQDRMSASGDFERTRREFIARQPMGRLGHVDEMAEAAVFLASDRSGFMTGSTLVLDGGQTI